ncbi:MAG: cytochrome c [Acidobacteriota bacterium]|nr:cytochrome c [Acidobacteriota bacterium]
MRFSCRAQIAILLASLCTSLARPVATHAQDGEAFFHQKCSACHTIGGGHLIGPDLKGVSQRKDRAWLVKFIQDPKAMVDSGDPYAAKLVEEAPGRMVMPTLPGMTPEIANAVLDYIDGGAGGKAGAAINPISDRPFTNDDVTRGRRIFSGDQKLVSGGPACISCHTLGTIGGLGGGRLGPDLTNVFDRLGGRKGVGMWLLNPPTPTMQAVFGNRPLKPEEILPLLAAIDDANNLSQPAGRSSLVIFFACGFIGMLIGLVLLQLAWRGRIRSVRRPIVRAHARGAQ